MKRSAATLLGCIAGCTPTIGADMHGEISQVRDPEMRADLDKLSSTRADVDSAESQLAHCIVAVAGYTPPPSSVLAIVLDHYREHADHRSKCLLPNLDDFKVGCTIVRRGCHWESWSAESCTPECLLMPDDNDGLVVSAYSTPCGARARRMCRLTVSVPATRSSGPRECRRSRAVSAVASRLVESSTLADEPPQS